MAASFSNMLIIPSSKITHKTSLGLGFPTALSPLPSSLTRKQKSIKLVRSSAVVSELVREQEHELELTTKERKIYKPKGKQVSEVWREIHGEKNWAGLLEPMDPVLRTEVIRYGEMAQACYDAFDSDLFSKYCGTCRFEPDNFFSSLHMCHLGYNVTQYIHLTSNINLPKCFIKSRWPTKWNKVNWGGYVAVSDDATSRRLGRRDIAIVWRGTIMKLEWVEDLKDYLIPVSSKGIPCHDHSVKAECGFLDIYTGKDQSSDYCKYSSRDHVIAEVKRLLEIYHDEEVSITVTGHSLGSALAILSAYDIVETGVNLLNHSRGVSVSVMSFSGPRVGNLRFKERLERLGVKVLRVVNLQDSVPKLPGLVVNENSPEMVQEWMQCFPWSYSHVGVELALDHKYSPFLNPDGDGAHSLEALLHLLDGYHGKGKKFIKGDRDLALVNKRCDFLKDSYLIPPNWWQVENKSLIRGKDGRWMQAERTIKVDDYPENMPRHLRQLGLASFEDTYMNGGDVLHLLEGEKRAALPIARAS